MRIISGTHFHSNNDGDGDKVRGDRNIRCGDGVGMGMLVHPGVTLYCQLQGKGLSNKSSILFLVL